ncbi:CatB-related O-acetyltransferase [Myroides odoratimimus]|uniref:CatB-related O-acetyltransferase n=1 Tax=Myroides odoratimimus TaxID=76832 RepID=UPI002DBA368C|nr:CatB-related O-acetyltransferase [Myroides odoratimimus]MEC4028772.1 CatB-related O-acetyltransferase [Myroides odoratimimus]
MIRKVLFKLFWICRFPFNLVKKNKVDFTSNVSLSANISRSIIGKYCYIGNNCNIVNTKIGNYCSIAPSVQIGGMEHSYWWFSTSTFLSDYCISGKETIIEEDVWIAAGAIIKQGVRIGRGSVIGAMTFVNKDVLPNSIIVGIPGKVLKNRFEEEVFSDLERTEFWNKTPHEARSILKEMEK